MALKTLITSAAVTALFATTSFAATERNDLIEQEGETPATEYTGEEIDGAPELQNAETKNRQDPQEVDPIVGNVQASEETLETFQAVEGTNGSDVMLEDGTKLGNLLEIGVDNAGRGEMVVDISNTPEVDGNELRITTGPENVSIDDGVITIAADAETISLLAGGDQGQRDGRPTILLN